MYYPAHGDKYQHKVSTSGIRKNKSAEEVSDLLGLNISDVKTMEKKILATKKVPCTITNLLHILTIL